MLGDSEASLARVAEANRNCARMRVQVGYARVAFDDAGYDAVPPRQPVRADSENRR